MKKLLLIFCVIACSALTEKLNAQPPGPGGGQQPGCFPPPCVPIDGGLSFLLIAGVAYGGKKALDLNKENPEEKH